MMNGIIVKREEFFLARISAKSAFRDEKGNIWSRELQAARVFQNHDVACRVARHCGGAVRMLKDGRVVE
ncbi:MAG: hypothetical protein IKS46_03405 [Clostridia bacterium]|nr:hypothetical protein [Clostridia bacterium]